METWYVMADGSVADPREVAVDATGVLRHKDGRAVDYAPHGPRTRGVDPEEERTKHVAAKAATKAPKLPDVKVEPKDEPKSKDMKPEEVKLGYKTRETKADL